jgi:glycosyltransferase involved in cell wall biosynthesis
MYLLAAYLVARLTRKPLYGYFHNTYYENHRDSLLARWLQPRVFAYARHIFVMSEGMQRLYQQNYPGLSCSPLVHTFNDPIPAFEPPPLHNPVRLCFSGSINPSCADAATRMAQLVQEVDNVQVTLLTGVPQVVVERTGFVGPKVTVTTVSRDELIDKLREADILLLPHGFTSTFAQEEIQTIFPTKVIEYLISGRSILAHMPGDCFLAEFLRRHNCALIVDEPSVEALKAGLQRLVEDDRLRAELVCNALRAAEQFRAPVVAAHLRKVVTHN